MLSASQIDTYLSCKRKWAWAKIARLEGTASPSAVLGSEVHAQLETYLAGGTLDFTRDSGYIAASGIEHLPAPIQLRLEREFKIEEDGLSFIGYIDLETADVLYDHKSTSSLSWAKTKEDLLYDVQAQVYTRKALIDGKPAPIKLQWTYMQTKGSRKSLPVVCEVSKAHNDAAWEVIKDIGHEIEKLRAEGLAAPDKSAYVKSLEPSPGTCEAYGGCPFRGVCNLTVRERTKAFMTQEKKPSLMERIEAAKAAKANGTTAPAQAAPAINPPAPAQTAPATAPVQAAETPAAPMEAPTEPAKRGRPKKTDAPTKEGFTLFWGCRPLDAPGILTLETVLAEAQKRIVDRVQVADYRLRGFGEGPGILAQTVAEILDELKPPVLVVSNTHTPEAGVCYTVLSLRASGTVVGT